MKKRSRSQVDLSESTLKTSQRIIIETLTTGHNSVLITLTIIGNALAVRFRYRQEGIEACQRYLVERYGWLPAVVRSLSVDDLYFLLGDLSADVIASELTQPLFSAFPRASADH